MFGLSATILVILAGGGSDYARLVSRRTQLQSAVDAGALAGGNALKLAMSNKASIVGLVNETIRAAAKPTSEDSLTTQVIVADDKTNVFASAEENVKLIFGRLVGVATARVAVRARANVVGQIRLCMLTLDPAALGAFHLELSAKVTALGCSLYSNSTSGGGMMGNMNAVAKASTICSAGGFQGALANFTPTPQTDCPALKDPLIDRPAPSVGPCKTLPATAKNIFSVNAHDIMSSLDNGIVRDTSANLIDSNFTLQPGTYCGGLHITENAVVTLQPGIYVFKDGPLFVDKTATLKGVDVGLYFTGDRAGLLFDTNTTISLSAPTSDVMSGLLLMDDRNVGRPVDPVVALYGSAAIHDLHHQVAITPTPPPVQATAPMRTYRIISNNARTMLGTIYLPGGRLVIDGQRPVADQSAYTVLVARQVNLYQGPNLVLNANYNGSGVPVPEGVGPLPGKLRLTQ